MKKIRTDAWEMTLDAETRDKLFSRCADLGYASAKIVAKNELKVTIPSHPGTWYRFLERMRRDESALRLAKALATKREIGDLAKKSEISNTEIVRSLQTLGASAALNGNLDSMKDFFMVACDLARTEAKAEELRIANEKLKLAQQKEAQATDTLSDKKLSAREKEAKLKEIYGM